MPERKALERRLGEEPSDLEVVTDGYGGVVDFNAARDTVQYVANEMFEGRPIDWQFELAKDARQSYDKSIWLVPQFTSKPKDEGKKQDIPLLVGVSVKESKAGPFKAGDRVRLKASIDDFLRFRKRFSLATGLAAIYYLDDAPTSVFHLKLEKAEIILLDSTK